MNGRVYLKECNTVKPYNRLLQGPTWGLSRVAKQLEKLARSGEVGSEKFQEELSYYPGVLLRLHNRGLEAISLNQGAGYQDIVKLFRILLYSSQVLAGVKSCGFELCPNIEHDLYPPFSRTVSFFANLDPEKQNKISGYLNLKFSPALRMVAFLAGTAAFYPILLGSAALGSYLCTKFGLPSMWFDVEQENRFGIDLASGGISGMIFGSLLYNLSSDLVNRNKALELTGPLWRMLREFYLSKGEDPVQGKTIAKTFGAIQPGLKSKDLVPLGYKKIRLVSSRLAEQLVFRAYVECEDTPFKVLRWIAFNRQEEMATAAFERIKGFLERKDLKKMVFSKNLDVRRESFRLVFDSFAAEINERASSLINIPQVFSHPKLSRKARIEAVKATVVKERSNAFLRAFSPRVSASEIQEIFLFLVSPKNESTVIDYNLEIFLDIIVDHELTPSPILFAIAKKGSDTAYSHRAMMSLLRRGKLNENMLGELKKAESDLVRVYACFFDVKSTDEQIAVELDGFVAKNEDLDSAWMLINLIPNRRAQILEKLMRINPRLAEELNQRMD